MIKILYIYMCVCVCIYIYIYIYENRIIKPVKIILKGGKGMRKGNRGGEFDQSTLYACMEIPQ
jgi:hypothetical protein